MRVRALWVATSLLAGCTFGSLTGGGGGITIGGGDDDGATASTSDDDVTQGPGDGGPDGSGSDAAASDGVDSTEGCALGTEGCECDGRSCDEGLACVRDTCVSDTCGDGTEDPGELCDDGNLDFGDGCDACVPTPGVRSIVGGGQHTCALLWTGGVRCWGESADGRLGYGNGDKIGDDEHPYEARNVPLGGAAVALSAGSDFTCALLDDATVRCWGSNSVGQLGNQARDSIGDDEAASESPVVQLGAAAVQISSGHAHTCAVLENDTVTCWGEGAQGRLGYGNQDDVGDDEHPADSGPVDVGGGVRQVSAGAAHTCARLLDDGLVCWGDGSHGRLGYGNTTTIGAAQNALPISAGRVQIGVPVQAVRAAGTHTCVLLSGGAVRCWGQNHLGQCGVESGESLGDDGDEHPVVLSDVELGAPASSIGARALHSCAVLENGTVKCWGEGALGRLGYGNEDDVFTPPRTPVAISADQLVERVAPGGEHTCVILDLGNVRCWGRGGEGQLGYANVESIGDMPGESAEGAGDVQVLPP